MKKSLGVISALTLGLGLALAAPTAASADTAGPSTSRTTSIPALSDTRATGHYEVAGHRPARLDRRQHLEPATRSPSTSTTDTPLADVGEPSLELTNNAPARIPPGYQLVVDFDGDGTADGILVGEPSCYGDNWWLNNAADAVRQGRRAQHTAAAPAARTTARSTSGAQRSRTRTSSPSASRSARV